MIPIEFLRHFRFNGYAIFDFMVVFLGVYILSPLLSKLFLKLRIAIPKQNWTLLTLPISIVTHLLVGNITPMTRDFIDTSGHYVLKVLILVLLIFGIKGIKIIREDN